MRHLGQGAVTSQAGLSNLNKINIKLTLHVNDDQMRYTHVNLPSLMCFMLFKGLYDSMMGPACDVTAWVREGKQYPEYGKEPITGTYVALQLFTLKT